MPDRTVGPADEVTDEAPPRRRASPPWQQDPVILARLIEVERRWVAGESNSDIAGALGVNETTIRRDRRRLESVWLANTGDKIGYLRSAAIRRLEHVFREAMQAAAFDLRAERAILFGTGDDGRPLEVRTDDRGSARHFGGKAQALNVARQAQMDIAKLQGVLVDKVAATDAEGRTLNLAELVKLARE